MLVWLAEFISQHSRMFHVFHYLTLRTILSALTALIIALWLGPYMIKWLKERQMGQQVRHDGPESHLSKAGTPTMGGALILIAITGACALWADLSNRYVWVVLAIMLGFGLIGWVDDYRKIVQKNSKGLPGKWKLFWQSLLTFVVVGYLYLIATTPQETALVLPFFKNTLIPLGAFYLLFSYLVIVGASNAVNLTDGLDGLAVLPTVLVGAGLGVFAYIAGHAAFANYLAIPFVSGAGELCVICGALVGAGLGFLWFNSYPAEVFMGDVGSLALGGTLGVIAVIVRQEIVLCIMGGIFVIETLSVILQVASFKLRGQRIFKMAPIHHHFELSGWPEPKVIVRFWIMTVILVLVGLATLKLR